MLLLRFDTQAAHQLIQRQLLLRLHIVLQPSRVICKTSQIERHRSHLTQREICCCGST